MIKYFGLEFDGTRIYTENGNVIYVPPKESKLFEILLNNVGSLVNTSEIYEHVWGAAVVGPESINRCVSSLRSIIAPHGKNIKSISRRGYILLEHTKSEQVDRNQNIKTTLNSSADSCEEQNVIKSALNLLGFRRNKNCLAAIFLLKNYVDKNPNSDQSLSIIAEIYMLQVLRGYVNARVGLSRASVFAKSALIINNKNPHAHAIVGLVKMILENNIEYKYSFEHAINADPEDPRVKYYVGLGFLYSGEVMKACECLVKAVEIQGVVPIYCGATAYVLALCGREAEGLAMLDRAIKNMPWDDTVYFFRSILKAKLGDFSGALMDVEIASEIDGGESFYYKSFFALYLNKSGKIEESKRILDKILASVGENNLSSVFLYPVSQIYGKLAARVFYKKIVNTACPHKFIIDNYRTKTNINI